VHAHQIVHLDLKPDNVLLAPGNVPWVTDFGLSTSTNQTSISESSAGGRGTASLWREGRPWPQRRPSAARSAPPPRRQPPHPRLQGSVSPQKGRGGAARSGAGRACGGNISRSELRSPAPSSDLPLRAPISRSELRAPAPSSDLPLRLRTREIGARTGSSENGFHRAPLARPCASLMLHPLRYARVHARCYTPLGTLVYKPPEMLVAPPVVSHAGDVYSYGAHAFV